MSMSALVELRDQLMAAGVISSECEFSTEWLGKSECYMRVLRYSGTEPSADAWVNCAVKLSSLVVHLSSSSDTGHKHWRSVFTDMRDRCYGEIDARARRRWEERAHRKGITAQ
jgi:hypothetical protein